MIRIALLLCLLTACHSKRPSRTHVCDYRDFHAVFQEAAEDQESFAEFKRHPLFNLHFEEVSYDQGKEVFEQINAKYPHLLTHAEKFRENDKLGNPRIYEFGKLGLFSPSTLAYMKIAGDLEKEFGSLEGWSVVEIGSGYGGQCKILSDLFHFKEYALVDMPSFLALSRKYLNELQIQDVAFIPIDEMDHSKTYDLVISHYTFTQSDRRVQKQLIKNVLKQCKNGYLVCHFPPKYFGVRPLLREELVQELQKFASNLTIFPEEPLRGQNNCIITWKADKN